MQILARLVLYRTGPALKVTEIRGEVRLELLQRRSHQRRYAIAVLELALEFATP